jgi:hypothetical protein
MSIDALFGLSILMSFIAFGIVTKLYIWPKLRVMPREDGLTPLLVPHTFRFIGLSFLIPGVASPSLSAAFSAPAAYGDLVAAILAVVAVLALNARASWAIRVGIQRVGHYRPLACNLPRPNRCGHRPWFTRSNVFHSDRRGSAAARSTRAHILAAAAARAIQPRQIGVAHVAPGLTHDAG